MEHFYTRKVNLTELKNLLRQKKYLRGWPQHLRQLIDQETDEFKTELKSIDEYKSDVKQFIYSHFAFNGYDCENISKWNRDVYVNR